MKKVEKINYESAIANYEVIAKFINNLIESIK